MLKDSMGRNRKIQNVGNSINDLVFQEISGKEKKKLKVLTTISEKRITQI